MFSKLLIANRGEIAVRVQRTAREMGIATVAVYSEVDREALHVRLADEAYLLGPAQPAQSYLNVERLLEVAKASGAQAIHPGYGFLAENAPFARAVAAAGLIWVGPSPDAIDAMGDKVRAREAMVAAGVPIVPGTTTPLIDAADAVRVAKEIGLPIALKASGGGGGKGLKVAYSLDEVESAFNVAQREAQAYFKNPTIYVEKYLDNPKHVELQILADKHGHVLHVGERDCSLQRRHQKLFEEAPPQVPESVLARLREAGVRAAKAIGYDSAGTIESLVSGGEFYFLEMNTRIQVEHTVTEALTGIDLIREQIRAAAGEPLSVGQDDVRPRGHAIEVRVNAEDPADDFRPAPGRITAYREPAGLGVRLDAAAYAGYTIPTDYDSLIAKLIVWAPTRGEALERLGRCLAEYQIEGVTTTIPFFRELLKCPAVVDASYGTASLELFAAAAAPRLRAASGTPAAASTGESARADETIRVEVNDKLFRVRLVDRPAAAGNTAAGNGHAAVPHKAKSAAKRVVRSGNDVRSPMHGVVAEIAVSQGQELAEGDLVAVVEAMKMMNEIRAHKAGTVSKVHAAAGATVEADAPLVTLA
ncbi:acetyl-CoA carboxylase biotin carboxylase subunit [bacterium]|nr:MAG: acetyl-CoA carboxylase biotin carboxylase subunit [bacterium]